MARIAFVLVECVAFLLGKFLSIIPHKLFVFHVKMLAKVLSLLDTRRYKDARANLDFVYGDGLSVEQKEAIIRRCYRNFAFVILESIRVVYLKREEYERRFVFIDEHFLTDCISKDGSAVVVSMHFGYWEAMATALPQRYRMCEMASLGRLTQFESINRLIIKRRESQGVRMIDKKGAFKHLLKLYSKRNAIAGILVDQNIDLGEGIEVRFFGKRATHTTIASVLSRRFGVAIVPLFIDFNEDYSRYYVRFCEPIRTQVTNDSTQDILQATQKQANITQQIIESNPSSWFWFHKRFKIFYPDIYAKKP